MGFDNENGDRLNEILKKSHKPPVYPKEPQTLNEFM